MIVLGRKSDGTPIVFGDVTSTCCYRIAYEKAKERAEKSPIENIEAYLGAYDDGVNKLNPVFRGLYKISEFLFSDPSLLAYRYVLKEKLKK